MTLYNTLKRKRDRFSNCSRQLVTKTIADQDAKKAKKVFHYRRLRHLANYDSAGILNHFKSGKTNKQDSDSQKKKIVEDFHERYIVSRVLPYKKLKKKIKLPNGERKHVPVRVTEAALFDAYKLFVTEHPGIKVEETLKCKDQNILDSKRMEKDWCVHAPIM